MEYKPREKYCKCSVCEKRSLTENMVYYKPEILDRDYFPEVKSMCSYKCANKVLDDLLRLSDIPSSRNKDYAWIKKNIFKLSPLTPSRIKTEEIIFLVGILLD